MHIQFADEPIGADVLGVSIASVTNEQFSEIYQAWLKRGVLRFREQTLDDDQLKNFSERFGPLEYAPHGKVSKEELAKIPNPYVATISNIVVNGRPIGGLENRETSWHTDMSYIEHPPTASLLYAVEVPQEGGETHFCSMRDALATLPDHLREVCLKIQIKHDAAHDSIGKLRRGHQPFKTAKDAPGALHHCVRQHPETGEAVLYLGRRQNAYIDGMSIDDSESMLDEIWNFVAKSEHRWSQDWQVGDLVVWDNRSVMHKRSRFPNSQRRLMLRTQVRDTR